MTEEPAQVEKRCDPRALARIAIFNGPSQKELITDYSVNLSTGGLFVETTNVLPVDTNLVVKFKLPGMDDIITCNSRVAWTNDPGNLKKPALPPGMGIQFLDLSLEDMRAIRLFIDKGELFPTW